MPTLARFFGLATLSSGANVPKAKCLDTLTPVAKTAPSSCRVNSS